MRSRSQAISATSEEVLRGRNSRIDRPRYATSQTDNYSELAAMLYTRERLNPVNYNRKTEIYEYPQSRARYPIATEKKYQHGKDIM
ncbi:MAG: hypothetical protein HC849_32690 [Oscillatoriales cyanobacterium RU_3_3]|nr:hypothetical protein [Oscillatoriales cyanobacterium RU_3_3]